ncbi:MAG: Anthranilate/para-aminobenzoate synthases component I [Candidatus Alkanophagales archaeon MCA70_species_2]|nr:Anthranilate/para-aminobenzoate synthases component I [Candidatus Alkanophaga liquidiphilum]
MPKVLVTPIFIETSVQEDPMEVYKTVRRRYGRKSYLLESREGSERLARYSFIGFAPAVELWAKDCEVRIRTNDAALKWLEELSGDFESPLEALRELFRRLELNFDDARHELPRFFGGFVGYLSYDLVRYFENISDDASDELKEPDCELMLAKRYILFDHFCGKMYFLTLEFSEAESGVDAHEALQGGALSFALDTLRAFYGERRAATKRRHEGRRRQGREMRAETKNVRSNFTKEDFERAVERAKRYIHDGDIFQVVLSQRFSADFYGDPLHVYERLRTLNPSPYMYFLDFGGRKVAGASPEMLLRIEGALRRLTTFPIAGTRPRGQDADEDKRLEEEMLSDEKERAEHVMLVDLGRNDIGRVAKPGSVRVTRFMDVEKYSHVQHIVSEVVGELADGYDEFDALASVFPAGTVTGAPKVRAMEIIGELEPTRRGIYAGCVGYFSLTRNLDTAITIRTIVFENCRRRGSAESGKSDKNGDVVTAKAYVQAGAGIVADSQPEREYYETVSKCMAMMRALGV